VNDILLGIVLGLLLCAAFSVLRRPRRWIRRLHRQWRSFVTFLNDPNPWRFRE
jgi:uncharacterized membrane protein